MINAALCTADRLMALQRLIARWRFRILLAIIGIYFFLAFAGPMLTDEAGLLLLKPGWRRGVDQYWLYGCVILIAGFAALGPGKIAMRLAQGLVGIAWLLMAWLVGLTMSPNWKFELEITTAVCVTIAVITFVGLLVVRRCTGKMFIREGGTSGTWNKQFQFSLTTLFLLMLVMCVTLAVVGWIDPRYRSNDLLLRARLWWIYPWVVAKEVSKVAFGPLAVALACLPAFLSTHKHRFVWALGLCAAAFMGIVLNDAVASDGVLHQLLQANPIESSYFGGYIMPLAAKLATVIGCLLTAATALHGLGYRLSATGPDTPPNVARLTTPQRSSRRRFRILLALICGYFFIAFAAPIVTDEAGLLLLKPHHWWNGFDRNWLCGCVILIAGSMALGAEPLPKRLVQGLIALGWFFLIWLLGLTMSPNWKPEIELTWLVCAAVAVTTFAVLILVRRFSGKMIVRADAASEMGTKRFQYTLTTLLLVMFLLCMTFALMGWIDPRYRNYFEDPNVQLRWYVSWNRREVLGRIGSDALTAILIAGACWPAFLSRRKRAFAWALGLSVVALAIAVVKDGLIRERILIPLAQGKPVDWWVIDYALIPYGVNWATLILCLLIAATAMHWLGYRLAGGQRLQSANQLLDT